MDRQAVLDALAELIDTCKDGEYGYRDCAGRVRAADLQTLFRRRAEDCGQAAHALAALAARYGGVPEARGSAAGAAHRGWIALRARFARRADEAMLSECERGEDAALERYRRVLGHPLPAEVHSLVQRQYEGVRLNRDEVRNLRDRLRRARRTPDAASPP